MLERMEYALEIEGPTATCGHCRFTTALTGTWSVEDGRLVWRGDADIQPRRGPDLFSCCEGRECGDFGHVTVDDEPLTDDQIAVLRASAREAQGQERERQ